MEQPNPHLLPAAWEPFVSRREWLVLRAGLTDERRADVLELARRLDAVVRDRFLGHLLDELRRADGPPVALAIERTLLEGLRAGEDA